MAIRFSRESKKTAEDWRAVGGDVPRVYTEAELRDFHQKIQRFYQEKTLSDGETLRIFDYDSFGVAYGALVKKEGSGKKPYYAACTDAEGSTSRLTKMENLLRQYHNWQERQEDYRNQTSAEFETPIPVAVQSYPQEGVDLYTGRGIL